MSSWLHFVSVALPGPGRDAVLRLRAADRELLRQPHHPVRENADLDEHVHHEEREDDERDQAQRGHRQQRRARRSGRAQQRRDDQHDHCRNRPEHEDDAVARVQTIPANEIDHPDEQRTSDEDAGHDARGGHEARLLARFASTTPSTTISAVLSGYFTWLSAEYIVVPCRRSATVIGYSPMR